MEKNKKTKSAPSNPNAPKRKEWESLSEYGRTAEVKVFGIKGENLLRALKRMANEALHALFKEYAKAYRNGDYITKEKITYELLYEDYRIAMLTSGVIKGEMLLATFENKCKNEYGEFVKVAC